MSQERLEILRMLSEGKINVKEAEMLLRAVGDSTSDGPQASKSKEARDVFQEIGQEIKQEVSRAVESVQRSDVGKIVSEVVSDVMGQVRESVSDALDGVEETGEKTKVKEHLDWTFEGTSVSKIDAQTVNGSIVLEGADRDQVVVRAWKEVRGKNRDEVADFIEKIKVHAEQKGDELRIYREHPKPPKGLNVTVRYEIESPRTMDVNLRTVNDKIAISGVDGTIDATTVNGTVKLHGDTGPMHVHTTNGNIEAAIGRLLHEAKFSTTNGSVGVEIHDGVAPIAATTTNGAIDLALPADFSGQLDAKTSNGQVHSDFSIPFVGKRKNRLEGQLGEGGEALVKLRSFNGSIRIAKHE